MSRSHLASAGDPATMLTNFLDRLQDDFPCPRIKVIGRLFHQRPFGLVAGFVQGEEPRARLIMQPINRSTLVAMQVLTVARKSDQVGRRAATVRERLFRLWQGVVARKGCRRQIPA